MPRIIPIKELKNTNAVSELCREAREPVFITKNGYGDMVLMSIETFEDMFRRMEIYKDLALSEKQFEEGKQRSDLKGLVC